MLNEQRGHARLPIMHVQHLRRPRQMQRQVRGSLGEEHEPLCIVRVISALRLIQISPLIERRLVHKIHRQPFDRLQAPGLAVDPLRPQREFQRQSSRSSCGKRSRIPAYNGVTTPTRCPPCASVLASAPTMSASPPVFE